MCGIVGSILLRGQVDGALLDRQRDAMLHRGPDSCGSWRSADARVGFGHRRLAIVDLSPGGHQPMLDPETGNALTFNGEIYNYLEVREELRSLGASFRTQSDTEVVLAAYRVWGTRCLERLDGMFALALYDERRQQVMLARDRAGEKPLFLYRNADGLRFASELKALLADPAVPRRVRADSLNEYLAYGYVSGEHTMLDGITRLAPASRLVLNLVSGEIAIDRYWELPSMSEAAATMIPTAAASEELVSELHELLKAAVKRQLAADVPVGVLLSGGVDSSIIAAIASEVSGTKVRTFTARFPGHGEFDEGPYAKLVAEHLGTNHTELDMRPASAALLESLLTQFDDPIADSSMIPTFLVSQEIRRHATVALGGDGGDELFGGYRHYPVQVRQEQLRRRVPALMRRVASGVASSVMPVGMPGRGFALALGGDAGTGISNAGRIFREDERAALSPALAKLSPAQRHAPELRRRAQMALRSGVLQQSTSLDFATYMVDDVLVKVDRASMLTSLEVRAPFLDRAVVEFAFGRVPDALRATPTERKVILRLLGSQLLPPALDLRRKQGFSIPVDDWMRGAWRELLDDVQGQSRSIISTDAIVKYRLELDQRQAAGPRLFALVALRVWERVYRVTDVA